MTTAIFRNIPILKLIPPPEILQKNPPIPVETPPRRIPILHTQIPLPIQTRKIPPNRKSAASFICGLDSLPMIRSENPCPKKKVIYEQRSVNGGKSTAFVLKVPNSSLEDSSLKGFLAEYYPVKGEIITKKDLTFESYPATKYQYLTEVNEEEKNVDALVCQTDDYTFGLFVLTPSDTYNKAAEKEATELIKSIDFVYAERVDMAMTDYFQVLTPERWKYLCHYETTETENGGYKLTYYNEDVPVLTLEARYYDGEDQPLDSVWQGYLGRIETVDGKKYDLLSTISQYSKDASDEWKEMYDTYLDVINGIRIMDGCSLTEGSHA